MCVCVCMCAYTHTLALVHVHMLLSLSLTQFKKSILKAAQCADCWALRISFHGFLRCFWQSRLLLFVRRLVVFTEAEAVIWCHLQLFWTFYWIGFANLARLVSSTLCTPVVVYRRTLLCLVAFWLWCEGLNSNPWACLVSTWLTEPSPQCEAWHSWLGSQSRISGWVGVKHSLLRKDFNCRVKHRCWGRDSDI